MAKPSPMNKWATACGVFSNADGSRVVCIRRRQLGAQLHPIACRELLSRNPATFHLALGLPEATRRVVGKPPIETKSHAISAKLRAGGKLFGFVLARMNVCLCHCSDETESRKFKIFPTPSFESTYQKSRPLPRTVFRTLHATFTQARSGIPPATGFCISNRRPRPMNPRTIRRAAERAALKAARKEQAAAQAHLLSPVSS